MPTAVDGVVHEAGMGRRRRRYAVTMMVGFSVALAVWAPGSAQEERTSRELTGSELVDRGGEVYQANCAACHGTRGLGGTGTGLADGPPLRGIALAYVDMTVRTGRMPIAAPHLGVYSEELGTLDREALIAYARVSLDTVGGVPTVVPGDASRGQEMYVRNCAACHGAAAGGGISGGGAFVPPLLGVDDVALAEAVRVGPFEMPAFDPAVLSDEDIEDIVGYLGLVEESPRTFIGLREVGSATGGLLAIALGVLGTLVLFIVARARRWYRHEPGAYHEAPPFEPRT